MSSGAEYFDEIDVTNWEKRFEETLGAKPKYWVKDEGVEDLWLMKQRTFNRVGTGEEYAKGDDWAERIASEVAVVLGVPAARCELAVDKHFGGSTYSVLSQKFLTDDEDIHDGNVLLSVVNVWIDRGGARKRGRKGYTVAAIKNSLETVGPPLGFAEDMTGWEVFVGYLLLDALIGNMDRHEENWAAIRGDDLRLAPSFDHASSLGFQLSDADRNQRLSTNDILRQPKAYAGGGHSCFDGGLHPVGVLEEALGLVSSVVATKWLGACSDIEGLVAPIGRVPEHRMSEPSRGFAECVMRANWQRIMDLRHV